MPKHVQLRTLTEEEQQAVRRIAASRTASQRSVQRAKVIVALLDDPTLKASEAGQRAGYNSRQVGPKWVRRFNMEGLSGLEERPRAGRKPIHSEEVKSKLVDLALQKPRSLGYPFELWTLERLQTAFEERNTIRSSWKKGGHNHGVCGASGAHPRHLHRRVGAVGGENVSRRSLATGPQSGYI
jgi:transposase